MKSDAELVEELRRATEGLLFMSESDYPFEVVSWDGPEEFTGDHARKAEGAGADTPVAEVSVEDFFRNAAGEQEWKSAAQLESAKRYQALVRLLGDNLAAARVYRVGEINIGVYVVGRSPEGNWLGLRTRVVET